jgi:hypothetical protein
MTSGPCNVRHSLARYVITFNVRCDIAMSLMSLIMLLMYPRDEAARGENHNQGGRHGGHYPRDTSIQDNNKYHGKPDGGHQLPGSANESFQSKELWEYLNLKAEYIFICPCRSGSPFA